MGVFYNIGVALFGKAMKLGARFNPKIKKGVSGREDSWNILKTNLNDKPRIWFHCASLGEYEQGLPVFQEIRNEFHDHQIILTFFSPSGYEIRKNTAIADIVCYLPVDTKQNAKIFVELVKPELTIFVKYDIWPNYIFELKKQGGTLLLISANFRKNHSYFKWYGKLLLESLSLFDHIFVQNDTSKSVLVRHGIEQVSISGDTRYDRVSQQLDYDNNIPFLDEFIGNNLCIICGSTWPADEELIVDFINKEYIEELRWIIAPHEVSEDHIDKLLNQINKPTVLFSDQSNGLDQNKEVCIIDNIGILSKAYNYGDIAYVGGGMGTKGLHNILEPSVFGIPVIIGKNFKNFPEALEMTQSAGVISVSNFLEFKIQLQDLLENEERRDNLGHLNRKFIEKNRGAVIQIMDFIRK